MTREAAMDPVMGPEEPDRARGQERELEVERADQEWLVASLAKVIDEACVREAEDPTLCGPFNAGGVECWARVRVKLRVTEQEKQVVCTVWLGVDPSEESTQFVAMSARTFPKASSSEEMARDLWGGVDFGPARLDWFGALFHMRSFQAKLSVAREREELIVEVGAGARASPRGSAL